MTTTGIDDFTSVSRRLLDASSAVDLFGPPTDDAALVRRGRREFYRLAALVHPDRVGPADSDAANHAFAQLSRWWNDWLGSAGIRSATTTITTTSHSYAVGRRAYRGEICELHEATYVHRDGERAALMKVPRSPRNNDLLATESRALRELATGDPRFGAYVPRLVESFRHRDVDTGQERQINVTRRLDGFLTIADVRDAFPTGLDPRDAAWMWRRLLVALGYVHRHGVIHAAVVPEHVLLHPELHGLVLVDFCYAVVAPASRLTAIGPSHRDRYPSDVLSSKHAQPSLDIYLAAHLMGELLGEQAPRPLSRFISGCLVPHDRLRPSDAWRLLGELDEILEDLYGPRRFRSFTLSRDPDHTAGPGTPEIGDHHG